MKITFFFLLISSLISLTNCQSTAQKTIPHSNEALTVTTWNIEHFPKKKKTTIKHLKKMIPMLNSHVIGLQEIHQRQQFKDFATKLPKHISIIGNNGLAYLVDTSKVVIQDSYDIFQSDNYLFPRAPHVLHFTYNKKPYIVINNHFKCCGNNKIEPNKHKDEETRRLSAVNLLHQWMNEKHPDASIIFIGDLNDKLNDPKEKNVFNSILEDKASFKFVDMPIAEGPKSNWSYPSWPSHLDHIAISNELFEEFGKSGSKIETIHFKEYSKMTIDKFDRFISDHYPVKLSLAVN